MSVKCIVCKTIHQMVYCDKTKATIFKSLTFGAGPLGCDICIAFIPFEIWKK